MSSQPRVILLLDAERGFSRGMLSGIARYSFLNGHWNFYRQPHGYLRSSRLTNIRELRAWKPDAAICRIDQADALAELNLPLVAYDANDYEGEIPCVVSDDLHAGRLAAEHLCDLGHRHFGFCGYGGMRWSAARHEAFAEFLEEAGHKLYTYRSERKRPLSWAKEEHLMRRWLESLPKPVGILAANDDRAATLVETCHALGYSIPEDVSVIGVDDDPYVCELLNPPLSSVRIVSEQAGYQVAALLAQLIDGSVQMEGQRVVARATGVTERLSTSAIMVRNAHVRKAICFIRENSGRMIRVSDVVKASGRSHRDLNTQFHQETGCSISQYLTRVKISRICHLLADTELQILEVAKAVGYEDDRHFARYFKRSTGETPQAYRRKCSPP